MKITKILIVLIYLMTMFCSCENGSNLKKHAKNVNPDGKSLNTSDKESELLLDSVKNKGHLIKEFKKESDIEAVEITLKRDTLSIVCTGWFFYYPFGKFHDLKS